MAQIEITESAAADMAAILADLNSRAGLAVAIKFHALFGRLYKRLENFPAAGSLRPVLGANIRIGIVFPYVVIYRYLDKSDAATVLRIVHGRRRMTGKLLTEASG